MDAPATRFHLLPGLPPYGAPAEPFSATGMGTQSEGFVVSFCPRSGESWVGNFQPGLSNFSAAENHPDGHRVIVVSGGQGYVVDPDDRKRWESFGADVVQILHAGDLLVFGTGVDFVAIGHEGIRWRTRRVSWDGMRNVNVAPSGRLIEGEAWSPLDDEWTRFEVDTNTGHVVGGSYPMGLGASS
jgi:hypothetical protein